jgi:hypothetical protein
MAKTKRWPMLAVVAIVGVVLAFLLRKFVSSSQGLTFTGPQATHYVGLNVICFWGFLGFTAVACLLLWRRTH